MELLAEDVPDGCRILVHGVQAHAAHPGDGCNAVTALLEIIGALPLNDEAAQCVRALSACLPHGDWRGERCGIAQSDELSGELTISHDIFELDATHLSLRSDARVPLCADDANCREVYERTLGAAGFNVSGEMEPGHHTSADGEFVRALLECYEHYTGLRGECIATAAAPMCTTSPAAWPSARPCRASTPACTAQTSVYASPTRLPPARYSRWP